MSSFGSNAITAYKGNIHQNNAFVFVVGHTFKRVSECYVLEACRDEIISNESTIRAQAGLSDYITFPRDSVLAGRLSA